MASILAAAPIPISRRLPARLFFCSLMLATAVPLLWLGFGIQVMHESLGGLQEKLLPLMAITSFGHVGATTFFYFDREMIGLIKQNRGRFLIYPLVAAVSCLVIYHVSAPTWSVISSGFLAWLLYHYQRQNYGLIAFAAQNCGAGKLPAEITWMLNLGVAGAVLRLSSPSTMTFAISALLFGASAVLLIAILCGPIGRRENWTLLMFLTLGWMFFLPSLVSTDHLIGFWSYAIAHGAQYLIFMIVLGANTRRGIVDLGLLLLAFCAAFILFWKLNSFDTGLAFYRGLVMGHFLIDAKVWRLREPLQRQIIGERFGFIFS